MSTRYVWEKKEEELDYKSIGTMVDPEFQAGSPTTGIYIIDDADNPSVRKITSGYIYNGNMEPLPTQSSIDVTSSTTTGAVWDITKYIQIYPPGEAEPISIQIDGSSYIFRPSYLQYGDCRWTAWSNYTVTLNSDSSRKISLDVWELGSALKSLGYVSSSSSNAYPNDGQLNGYTYKYQGSDNIDPASIGYPADDLSTGKITVYVTPSNQQKYGGTITYRYEYRRNNGSWILLTTTTATTTTYTIPDGTNALQFRVKASDNLGFTSADYVTGPIVDVWGAKIYVGVDGKAQRVSKVYVGINGKARQVVKGYVGVNGKAKRFL